ncbi:MAG: septal ring lytic transglycosylase RlpA family protein [Pseudomonadota bacterium]|nr:septal ring lytic transglycosylase RlpA family protein [Pseudomonadota bacterium]
MLRPLLFALIVAAAAAMPAQADNTEPRRPEVASATAVVPAAPAAIIRGRLSWYGRKFAGMLTASGQPFDPEAMTMAHRTLPFGTLVRVTNLANHRSTVLRVNDRGPFTGARVADVSAAAARELRMRSVGVIHALLEVVGRADGP